MSALARCVLRFVILLAVLAGGPAAAIEIRDGLGVLRDPGRQLRVEEVASRDFERIVGSFNLGFSADAIWIRVPLPPLADGPRRRVLEITHPFHDDIRLYVPAPGGAWIEKRGGEDVPAQAREIDYRHPSFYVDLADRAQTAYLRIVSRNSILGEIHLIEEPASNRQAKREGLIYGLFFGIYLAILLFHAFFWRWTGEPVSGWYFVYVASSLVTALIATGYLQQYADLGSRWTDHLLAISQCVSLWTVVRFSSLQLELGKWMPRSDRLLRLVSGWPSLVFGILAVTLSYRSGIVPMQVMGLSASLALVVLPAWLWRRGHAPARFFFFAFGVLFLGIAVRYLTTLGLLPGSDLSTYAYQIGAAAHMVLMSLAITSRYNELKREVARTQHRLLEEQKHVAEQLEQEVLSRTASLVDEIRRREVLEDQLREALVVEQQARQEQKDFVAMVSHEFRTPLAIISTSVQQLAGHLDAPKEKSLTRCRNIRDATGRLTDLMDDYLSLDRIEDTARSLSLRRYAVAELLDAAVDQGEGGKVDVACSDAERRAVMTCDPSLVQIALRNLVANALRHSPEGSPVRLSVIAEPDGWLRFDVQDQGPGIPADEMPRLFQKYFRGRAAQQRPGAGLGLYLVSRIATMHGGTISVTSSAETGTCFSLRLPVSGPDDSPPP